jgi:hypothetical protein
MGLMNEQLEAAKAAFLNWQDYVRKSYAILMGVISLARPFMRRF